MVMLFLLDVTVRDEMASNILEAVTAVKAA
jgi:hypothetical protein